MSITQEQDERLQGLLEALEPLIPDMNNWEQGFVKDQIERHRQYGTDIFMSPKQWAALQKIHDEYVGDDPAPDDRPPLDEWIPF